MFLNMTVIRWACICLLPLKEKKGKKVFVNSKAVRLYRTIHFPIHYYCHTVFMYFKAAVRSLKLVSYLPATSPADSDCSHLLLQLWLNCHKLSYLVCLAVRTLESRNHLRRYSFADKQRVPPYNRVHLNANRPFLCTSVTIVDLYCSLPKCQPSRQPSVSLLKPGPVPFARL